MRATCNDFYLIKLFTGLKYTVKQKQNLLGKKFLLGKRYWELGKNNIVLSTSTSVFNISSRKVNFC